MIAPRLERRLLQAAVAVAGIVPVGAGLAGALGRLGGDTHLRYLSGLLLGIGLAFWLSIPTIERRGDVFRLLAGIVVVGGLARLGGGLAMGFGPAVVLPLVMELGVTPLLALWRERVQRRLQDSSAAPG